MKEIHIFPSSSSQPSTSISLSMEPQSPPSSINLIGSQSPAIDRHNPIIRDSSRLPKQPLNPPIIINNNSNNNIPKPHKKQSKKKNKKIPTKNDENNNNISNDVVSNVRKRWSCTKPGDFISPPGSTRYLLSDNNKVLQFNNGDGVSGLDPTRNVFTGETSSAESDKINELWDDKSKLEDQVVVLRVSLHCRGCERKMRKHISKMEGVTSFNIDFMAKKVTVTGNVTPLEVLSSISKVKNAQLLTQSISSSTPPTLANLHNPDLNKEELILKL